MSLTPLLATALATLLAGMALLWLASLIKRDASLVDRFWGLGFVAAGWLYWWLTPGETLRKTLVVALVTVWGLRLSAYISWRNWGEGEDYRYAEMRREHGPGFRWRSLFTVFLLQGAILWLVSFPLAQAQRALSPTALTPLDLLGLACWAVGFLFEAGGDLQLARFKADPANRGKVLDRGFWRYTRHPNYFGDAMVWWGFTLLALATPSSWWVLISPLVMTTLLMKVSGVALLEKKQTATKPAYRDYVERTNAFFPWFPKRG